jgi:spore germination protein GerM
MTPKRRDLIIYATLGAVLTIGLVVLFFVGPRWLSTTSTEDPVAATAASDARKIRARLFYVAEDGTHLSPVEQEVIYGEGTVEQAKRIIEAQVAPAKAPLVSAIPEGTKLKTIFLTQKGEAFVDLNAEFRNNHPGGTTNEILTTYTLVNALTMNLPGIIGVQILIDGKEVETLAGHIDLRRPLEQDERWVTQAVSQ